MYTAYSDGYASNATDFDFDTYAIGNSYNEGQFDDCAGDSELCRDGYGDLTNAEQLDYGAQWDVVYKGFYLASTVNESAVTSICGDWTESGDVEQESDGTWYCEPGCEETDMLEDRNQVIMSELQIQLVTLFLTAIVIQNTLEVGVPFLKEYIARKREGDEDTEKSEAEVQMDKERYSNTIDDMSEMVVQFGYVTLFVMCFPLIPLLAIINNIFELKVDATNLVMSSQRPDPNGSDGLGTWNSVLSLFSILSVGTNALLITSRTNLLSQIIADDGEVVKLYFFCGFSIFLGVIVAIEKWVIPDEPDAVDKAVERQRLVESVLIKGTALDDEDDDKKSGPPADKEDDWPFDPHPESLEVIESTKRVPIRVSTANPDSVEQ